MDWPAVTVPLLVSEAAKANPGSPALLFRDAALTYGELDERSGRLAGTLRGLGIKPEDVVAVSLERSFDSIISALAIWKAGGAYLPLDPAWPEPRRSGIIEDARAPVVITRTATVCAAERIVNLDEPNAFSSHPEFSLNIAKPSQLAYVIYTSGSTGKPKGVEVTHANLMNLIRWHREVFDIGPGDRGTHLAGLGFDASVWELWPYLSAGASIALTPDEVRTSPELLQEWLVRNRVTVSFVPTALAEPMVVSAWPDDTALRYLLTGADKLNRYPIPGLPFKFVNNYGPTECTVVASSGIIGPSDDPAPPALGKAISNTQIYLLNDDLHAVDPGQRGEIYIGGLGVARAYRNQPAITEERFVPDPYSGIPGARMYRTGDIGSLRCDGQLAFHGRADFQEKIRGYRIEPDEVAFELARHPKVTASAVVGYGEIGDRRLAAYVVSPDRVSPDELIEHLMAKLPEYMIPSAFVHLDALPLTTSGKLNRAALPAPREPARAEYRPPESHIEIHVARILSELMNIDSIGLDDRIVQMGGDSLLATRFLVRIRERFRLELTLRELYQAPTVATLASKVESQLLLKIEAMSEEQAEQLLTLIEDL